jgi:hypothetical protein
MEKLPDNVQWADKLQEVSLPDAVEAWKDMAAILDKEMPTEENKDRRRGLLLLFLLLVLSGSGYFLWRTHAAASTSTAAPSTAAPTSAAPATSAASTSSAAPTSTPPTSTPPAPTPPASTPPVPTPPVASANHSSPNHSPKAVYSLAHPSYPAGAGDRDHPGRHSVPHSQDHKADLPASSENGIAPVSGITQQQSLRYSNPGKIQPLGIAGPHLVVKVVARPKGTDPTKCPPVEPRKGTGFVFAIGLNQAVPVDGQQYWTNPSGGLNTWWKNYIPVPSIRYYVRPKLYLQLEARIHAPQYTPRDLTFLYQYSDTSYSGWIEIKKLFYFQLPVSIHYSPSDNWSVGLGVQYSHYGKGIAALSDSSSNTWYATAPLSDFPMVFVKKQEFRGLISVDYTYRNWVLGTSYDEAFTRALTVKVPNPATMPQAAVLQPPPSVRNSSLQLYLRYILWDGRKKKPLLPAK